MSRLLTMPAPRTSTATQPADQPKPQSPVDTEGLHPRHGFAPSHSTNELELLAVTSVVRQNYNVAMRQYYAAAAATSKDMPILSAETYGQTMPAEQNPLRPSSAKKQMLSRDIGRDITSAPAPRPQGRRAAKIVKKTSAGRKEMDRTVHAQYDAPAAAEEVTRAGSTPPSTIGPSTTSERRRQQMRQAQRNYRLRREATISSLEARNQLLEEVVDGMTRSFMTLQDAAMQCKPLHFYPHVTKQMQVTSGEFLAWAKMARDGGEEGDEEDKEMHQPEEPGVEGEGFDGPEGLRLEGPNGGNCGAAATHVQSTAVNPADGNALCGRQGGDQLDPKTFRGCFANVWHV